MVIKDVRQQIGNLIAKKDHRSLEEFMNFAIHIQAVNAEVSERPLSDTAKADADAFLRDDRIDVIRTTLQELRSKSFPGDTEEQKEEARKAAGWYKPDVEANLEDFMEKLKKYRE